MTSLTREEERYTQGEIVNGWPEYLDGIVPEGYGKVIDARFAYTAPCPCGYPDAVWENRITLLPRIGSQFTYTYNKVVLTTIVSCGGCDR